MCKYGRIHHGTLCVYCERDALKALVREINKAATGEIPIGYFPRAGVLASVKRLEEIVDILNRTKVRAIIEEE